MFEVSFFPSLQFLILVVGNYCKDEWMVDTDDRHTEGPEIRVHVLAVESCSPSKHGSPDATQLHECSLCVTEPFCGF